jgi:hypothetical protein
MPSGAYHNPFHRRTKGRQAIAQTARTLPRRGKINPGEGRSAGADTGGDRAAIAYTILSSCRLAGVDPLRISRRRPAAAHPPHPHQGPAAIALGGGARDAGRCVGGLSRLPRALARFKLSGSYRGNTAGRSLSCDCQAWLSSVRYAPDAGLNTAGRSVPARIAAIASPEPIALAVTWIARPLAVWPPAAWNARTCSSSQVFCS